MKEKIAIATKGRVGKQYALELFNDCECFLFVEPQEYTEYNTAYGNRASVINIGENDKGLCFVRNYILNYFNEPVWFVDDDVDTFSIRLDKERLVRVSDTAPSLEYLHDVLLEKKLHQLGVSFIPSNRFFTGKLRYFYRAWAIKLIDCKIVKELGVKFGDNLGLYEDYQFTIDLSLNKGVSATTFEYAFSCSSKMGTNKGGCQTFRTPEKSLELAKQLYNKYGKGLIGIKFVPEHNQYEASVKWKELARRALNAN